MTSTTKNNIALASIAIVFIVFCGWFMARELRKIAPDKDPYVVDTEKAAYSAHCEVCRRFSVGCWDVKGPKYKIVTNENGGYQLAVKTYEATDWHTNGTILPSALDVAMIQLEVDLTARLRYAIGTNVLQGLEDARKSLRQL